MGLTAGDVANCYTNGQVLNAGFHKTPSQTTAVGIAFDLSMSPGNPPAQYYGGAPMTSVLLARSTDGGLNHGANKSPYKKYLHKISIRTPTAAIVPMTVEALDYCAFYSGVGMDAGVQNFNTTLQTSRYSSGLQMMLVEQFAYAGSSSCQITYTNDQGVAGRVTPVLTLNTQVATGTIATSAPSTAGCAGIYIPLQSGDTGVMYPTSIEFFGAGNVGVLVVALVKPLAAFQIYDNLSNCPWDFLLHQNELPQIVDDAYLNLICTPFGSLAAAPISGLITTIWN